VPVVPVVPAELEAEPAEWPPSATEEQAPQLVEEGRQPLERVVSASGPALVAGSARGQRDGEEC